MMRTFSTFVLAIPKHEALVAMKDAEKLDCPIKKGES
jgi:hypothetical protein